MLEIRAPEAFYAHSDLAGSLGERWRDPRKGSFEEEVVVDMRDCSVVGPAAALWCAVYATLARRGGAACRVIPPADPTAWARLSATRLFEALDEEGVRIDGRIPVSNGDDAGTLLPLTRFRSRGEGEQAAIRSAEAVNAHDGIPANLLADIPETFGELVNNAAEHSASPVGGFGLIQFRSIEGAYQLLCAVADGGIGIKESLSRNPDLPRTPTDSDAILCAMRERVSGTGSPTRGIGLCWVIEGASRVSIHSGFGAVVSEGGEPPREIESAQSVPFPGTLALASIGKK